MLKIRLTRRGKKHYATYRIIVAEAQWPRDGKHLDDLGYYNPMVSPIELKIDLEELDKWIKRGAQPTDKVKSLVLLAKNPNYINKLLKRKEKAKARLLRKKEKARIAKTEEKGTEESSKVKAEKKTTKEPLKVKTKEKTAKKPPKVKTEEKIAKKPSKVKTEEKTTKKIPKVKSEEKSTKKPSKEKQKQPKKKKAE